jgi:hypothetical protein
MNVDTKQTRPLTHDEKKAAEAAFRGAPFNSDWSDSARKIYEGLTLAIAHRRGQVSSELELSKN